MGSSEKNCWIKLCWMFSSVTPINDRANQFWKASYYAFQTVSLGYLKLLVSEYSTLIPSFSSLINGLNVHYSSVMEKAMAPHSSTLAWKIPWGEEPARLQSMGSLRVGHDWATSLSFFTFLHWRRKWQPTPVFLPGESQGWGTLVGCCLWRCTESDMTEAT